VLVWTEAKVLDGLTSILRSPQENCVRTCGSAQRELVEGKTFAAGIDNASASGTGEAKGGNGQLGDFEEAGDG